MKCGIHESQSHQQVLRVSQKSLAALQRRVHQSRRTDAWNDGVAGREKVPYIYFYIEGIGKASFERSFRASMQLHPFMIV